LINCRFSAAAILVTLTRQNGRWTAMDFDELTYVRPS
jgi:hypothetical protein